MELRGLAADCHQKGGNPFSCFYFFYRALQWHLESLLQMTLCPRIRKTVGVSLLQVCACNIPPLCILALVQLVVPKKEKLDEL